MQRYSQCILQPQFEKRKKRNWDEGEKKKENERREREEKKRLKNVM